MGFWPFRRGSNRRKSVGGPEIPRAQMHDAGAQRDPARHDGSELASAGLERRRSRRDTKRKSSRDSKKLQRDPEKRRTYSFSPGRKDSIRVPPRDANPPPVPPLPSTWKGKGRTYTEGPHSNTQPRPLRASTQPADSTQEWQRMPTLHKRSAQEMARRKSSKKRKEDHDRELEIKAMVAFMPTRAAEVPSSGKLCKKESQKMRGGLNGDLEGPSSDTSLPTAESLNSSRSENSGKQTSFKLSALDMLSPRPTIRYHENPSYAPDASEFVSERSESRMKRIPERFPLTEGELKAKQRIDELADDLSASELRELMERDQKRKEKKKIAERIRMEQRISRRQEKQRADEAIAARDGTPSPPIMDRGVMGREVVGLGIGTSAIVTSSKRKNSTGSDSGRGKRPAETFRQESPTEAHSPFNDTHPSASLGTENLTPTSEHSDPIIETAQFGTVGKASISPQLGPRGHTRGASSISQMMELNKQETPAPLTAPVIPVPPRRSSETSTRAPSSWTSFFKLRARNKSGHGSTPSSFSNTSRDSMHGGSGPQIGYQPMRSTSNIPKRTMSKFREDLPELPISPPDSRVQSPESGIVPDSVPPIRTGFPDKRGGNRASLDDQRTRYDTPTSGNRSTDAMRLRDETPTSGHRSEIPSPEPTAALAQSLASIDSEGSWLSGRRPSKRGSNQIPQHHFHDSSSSLNKKYKEFSESAEELGIAEDEYFSRLTPGPEEEYKIRRQSAGNPMPSSDEEDGGSIATSPVASEETKWGAVARHPTVVHREPRAKSREGLLNDFVTDSTSEVVKQNTSDSTRKFNASGVQRATSVDLGKGHARHISAGSAKLLDLKRRASGDAARVSSG